MDKVKFNEILESMGSIGSFMQIEVLKGQEPLAFAEIPPGDGDPAHQVYVITKEKMIWATANQEDGFMMYRSCFLNNILEYEFGKIPVPDKIATKAMLRIKFLGDSEVAIESSEDNPEKISERHEVIVQGIDDLERQLRKLTKYQRTSTAGGTLKH
jgi:hypothetical protein